MRIVILDGYTTNPGDLSWEWLSQFGDYKIYDYTKPEEIIERARGHEIVITNKTPLNAKTLSELSNIKYIGLLSTGYNVVDIEKAAQMGVPVVNIPTYSTAAVVQHTFALLFELTNHVGIHNESVHSGDWCANRDFSYWKTPLVEVSSKTFGIIGYGRIGSSVADAAKAFGMKVLAHTPHPPSDAQGVEFVGLDELLARSDVISLHSPLTKATEKMVNRDFLSKMKKTAYLINTSRGVAVDEAALAQALNSGWIAGAGVDVLSTEPPKCNNPLLECEKCIITPHIAWAGFETRKRLMNICEDNIRSFLSGKLKNAVNAYLIK
jgi:glycerate dehydrogenase